MQEDNWLLQIQYNYIGVSHRQGTCLQFSIALMEGSDFPDITLTYFNTEGNGQTIFGWLCEDFSIFYELSMKNEFRHIQTLHLQSLVSCQ